MPHPRRVLLYVIGVVAVNGLARADPDDRLRIAAGLLDPDPPEPGMGRLAVEGSGPEAAVADRFSDLQLIHQRVAAHLPLGATLGLHTYPLIHQLETATAALRQATVAIALLRDGAVGDRFRDGAARRSEPTPEDILELADVAAHLQRQPALRRRRRDAERRRTPAPPDDRPLWTVRYWSRNGAFEAKLDDESAPPMKHPTLTGLSGLPAIAEDLLRQWAPPAGAPVRIRWTHGEGPPPVYEDAELNLDRDQRRRAMTAHTARMAEMTAAVTRLRDLIDPADLPEHLASAGRRLQAEQPPTPGLAIDGQGGCLPDIDQSGRATGLEWVNPAAIVYAGHRPWGQFGSHRPEQLRRISARLLTADDPDRAIRQTFIEQPMKLHKVQGPAGPLYEVADNGLHRTHVARLLPLPWVFADVRLRPLPWAVEPDWDHEKELTGLWQGLLRHGLATGRLVTDPAARLELDWVAAQWLVAPAAIACPINRAYERVYPGAWEASGVPAGTASDAGRWTAWLTSA